MFRSQTKLVTLVACGALLVAGSFSWWFLAAGSTKKAPELTPQFVGDQSCRECHGAIYDSYKRSPMNQTWQPLTSANAIENFEQNNQVYDQKRDLHYEMIARDDQFFQKEFRLNEQGGVTHELVREISYVIGSGEHARGYVSDSNGYLNEMPIWWFREKASWDLSPSTLAYNFRFERPLTAGCVSCHTDSKQLVEGTFNLYESSRAGGIGCERCHGPAQWHVRQQRDGWEPPTHGIGREMFVNPARLPPDRKDDVCFQCHLQGDAQFPFPDQDQFGYRPGLRLADFRCDYLVESADPDAFGIVSHAARMVQSRCYTESNGRLNCVTCHDPHVASREVPAEIHRKSCLSCHAPASCTRVADSSVADRQNDCITCHMPRGEPTYVEHTVYTDHWIRRPKGRENKSEQPPAQIARLRDFWDDPRMKQEREGIAHIAYSIFKGNQANLDRGIDMLDNLAERGALHREGWRRLGMAAMLKGDARLASSAFDRAVTSYPNDAALRMGLGSALHLVGDRKRALAELEKAIQLAPEMIESYIEAAGVLVELQQPQRARDLLEDSLTRYPHQVAALATLGMIYHQFLGDIARGIDAYRRAIELDPDNAILRFSLGSLHMAQNELDAAREQLQQVLRAAPEHVPTLLLMARLHILRHEKVEAIDRLRQVLRLDPQNTQARNFLQELGESTGPNDDR